MHLAEGQPPNVRAEAVLWLWWAEIAIDQERLAADARSDALTDPQHGDFFFRAFSREARASLIAIAAAAHSLDALYTVVRELVEPCGPAKESKDNEPDASETSRTRRRSLVLETLKKGATVRGRAGAGGWEAQFKWLFDERGRAVHPMETMQETVQHPTGVDAAEANQRYRSESATHAVNFLMEVLKTCLGSPKPALKSWAESQSDTFPELERRRGSFAR